MWSGILFIAGLVVGAGAAGLAARYQIKRSLAKVQLAERRARGAERLAEIGAMTGGLAHEIKNPLSTIGLNAQLLGEGLDELQPEQPVTRDHRDRLLRRTASLRREVERLRGILTDFLNYAGELRLDPKPQDINRVVGELIDFFAPQAEQNGVRLRTDLSVANPVTTCDAALLKQALLNLLLNAVQAMSGSNAPTTKELIVRTARKTDTDGAPLMVIHVIDTGPGISDEAKSRLFTPYFTTKAGGTGLGLPRTRRIVDAHGGRIEVISQLGQGTDFQIVLPGK